MGYMEWAQLVVSLLGNVVGSQQSGGTDFRTQEAPQAGGVAPEQAGPPQSSPTQSTGIPQPGALTGPIQQGQAAGAQTSAAVPNVVVPPRATLPQPAGQAGPPQPVGTGGPQQTALPTTPPASLGEILQAIGPALAGNDALFGGGRERDELKETAAPVSGQNAGVALSARNPQIDIGRLLASLPGI